MPAEPAVPLQAMLEDGVSIIGLEVAQGMRFSGFRTWFVVGLAVLGWPWRSLRFRSVMLSLLRMLGVVKPQL